MRRKQQVGVNTLGMLRLQAAYAFQSIEKKTFIERKYKGITMVQ